MLVVTDTGPYPPRRGHAHVESGRMLVLRACRQRKFGLLDHAFLAVLLEVVGHDAVELFRRVRPFLVRDVDFLAWAEGHGRHEFAALDACRNEVEPFEMQHADRLVLQLRPRNS